MASEDNSDSGPSVQFSWNFPVVRVFSGAFSGIGSTVQQRRPGIITGNVADRITDSDDDSEEDDDEQQIVDVEDDDSPLNDIRDRLSDLSNRETAALGGSSGASVTYDGGVFVPLRSDIDVGEEVTWDNRSGDAITLSFNDGDTLNVPAGDTASREFNGRGTISYNIRGVPQEEVCGAVLVGDVSQSPVLPCESDVERELIEGESSSGSVNVSAPSSMSVAADEKVREY